MKVIKPKPGQVWAFRGVRPCTIKAVKRGIVGSWKMVNGRLKPLGKATAMWVIWTEPYTTITVTALWKNFTFVR